MVLETFVEAVMERQPAIHTSRRGAKWVNTREGSSRVLGAYDTPAEAAVVGRRLARAEHVEHVSHHVDGLIDEITVAGG